MAVKENQVAHLIEATSPKPRGSWRRGRAEALRLYADGRFFEANFRLHQLLAEQGREQGLQHLDYAATMFLLGELQLFQNELMAAEHVLLQVAQIRRNVLGENHPDYAACLSRLAQLRQRQCDRAGAEPLFRQAIAIRKETLGEHHPDYAASLGGLAGVLFERGCVDEAERLLREAIAVRQDARVDDQAGTLALLTNLALLHQRRADSDKGEPLLRQALAIGETFFGKSDPTLAIPLVNLAQLLQRKGALDEAETHLRRALTIEKEAFGECHERYAAMVYRLALLLWHKGERPSARLLLREALGIRKKLHGEMHPEYAHCLSALGAVQFGLGDLERSESLVRRAIEILKETRGEECIEYAESLVSLAAIHESRGAAKRAEPLWRRAVEIRDRLLGVRHPDTRAARRGLAGSLRPAGEPAHGKPPRGAGSNGSASRPHAEPAGAALLVPALPEMAWQPIIEPITLSDEGLDLEAEAEEEIVRPEPRAESVPIGPAVAAAARLDEPIVRDASSGIVTSNENTPVSRPVPVVAAVPSGREAVPSSGLLRRHPMPLSSNDLSQELASLSDRFSELGERMLHSARQLHSPGLIPGDDLTNEIDARRNDFYAFRDLARELAESLHVKTPPDEQLASLNAVTALLDDVAEAEIRMARSEEVRSRALSTLDRVLGLTHATNDDFAPLRDCHEKARALRGWIASAPWVNLHQETEPLAEGDHPFAHLLTLLEDRDEIHDDLWATLHDSVSATFGKSLAAAAARAKLVLPETSDSANRRHAMAV